MIVEFDVKLQWRTTAGDLVGVLSGADEYKTPPHLAIFVMHYEALRQLGLDAGNLFYCKQTVKADCLVGWHSEDAPVGWPLPQYAVYRHSKMTIFRIVEDDSPASLKLSKFLAGAPTEAEIAGEEPSPDGHGDTTPMVVTIPPMLLEAFREMANRRGVDFDALAWEVLLTFVEEEL